MSTAPMEVPELLQLECTEPISRILKEPNTFDRHMGLPYTHPGL